ncbi:DegT/DnrJ/EryC1/StrS family aminotransferase [Pararhodospirillum photometricum]|uniref:DegT/DnrJ/EryC1/StrS family aminotransferase n=1 Tax=Pararhodospirillum photometricum TaxID=1084 RepID=UPI002412744D|nr:aminotransferase class I/II-fold pyridoxal phosphate-dependent enzyme [Pararhodospirillum photometricum]
MPYIERIDEARWYSNFGPLHNEFRLRIARHFNLGADQVIFLSNATVGIALALQAVGLKRAGNRCVCPSWTFAATPHAIVLAGMSPVFADVDATTWTLNVDQVENDDIHNTAGVVVVSPFGGIVDMDRWERFAERSGVPVVCDAAASFDAVGRGEFRIGTIPIVISLHATKPLGAGEGAIVLCTDPDIIERIRQMSNFGFSTTSVAQVPGTNAKLNEYNCAIGLASLNTWPETRAKIAHLRKYYHEKLEPIDGISVFGVNQDYVSNYMIIETSADGYQLSNHLSQRQIETRRWWRSGCHQHPAFSSFNVRPLPQTRRLGVHTLGLPFFGDITQEEIDKVIDAVGEFCIRSDSLNR